MQANYVGGYGSYVLSRTVFLSYFAIIALMGLMLCHYCSGQLTANFMSPLYANPKP